MKSVHKMAKVVIRQNREFLAGRKEWLMNPLLFEIYIPCRHTRLPFLHSSLPDFLRGLESLCDAASVFGSGSAPG